MARYITAGAETRDTSALSWDGTMVGSVTCDTGTFRSGSASFKCDSGAGNTTAEVILTINMSSVAASGDKYWYRAYFNFAQLPSASVVTILTANGGTDYRARITSGGKLQLWNASAQVGSDSAATITTGTWYRVELAHDATPASGSRTAELRLDGVTVATITNGTFTAQSALRFGWGDAPGASKVVYVDDVGANDSTGAANTSWLGAGNVVMLLPISDNARASLWTGGAGGTTSLFDAVNNTPPVGTATETNTSQIEHAGGASGTTDAYDANMTSYTTAGVGASDTVNVVAFYAAHGEDASTGQKLLNFEVVSNPAIASPGNTIAGADQGALGTYPAQWSSNTAIGSTQAPSVTLGTSPVMRARRPETASRVASVCAMYMYVDYTPAASALAFPPFQQHIASNYLR